MMLPLLSSMVLCALGLWLLFGALATLIYRLLQPGILAIDPSQASLFLLAWLALPSFTALLTCYVLYSPDIAQWLVVGHCHVNTCSQHGPQSTLAIIPTTFLLLWTLHGIGRKLRGQWLPTRRLYKQLCLIGNGNGDFVSLGSTQPIAFTLGWLKPRIFISAGMQAACSAQDLECILRHESAHRQRRDNLRLFIARLLAAPLPESWSLRAWCDLKLCCEMACDLHAARRTSRESVAAALLRVARVQQENTPSGALAFAGNATEQRVMALIAQPQPPMAGELVFATVAVTLLIVLALINPLHRAIELIP